MQIKNNIQKNLKLFLIERIKKFGAIRLDEYINICMLHPKWGYYNNLKPIGTEGSFITSPEISQIFGEIIAAWIQDIYSRINNNFSKINLIELGPGRGILMVDILKNLKLKNFNTHLIEQSRHLQKIQKEKLCDKNINFKWHASLGICLKKISNPFILIANEFLDSLPVRQFIRMESKWAEILVNITKNKNLTLAINNISTPWMIKKGNKGDIFEISMESERSISIIANALDENKGIAIFIDYGFKHFNKHTTIQALEEHKPTSILKSPGNSDITTHVNFTNLQKIITKYPKIKCWPIINQSEFLLNLGIHQRTKQLFKKNPKYRKELEETFYRLISPKIMGKLFKIWIISSKNFPVPEPFFSNQNNL